MALDYVAFRYFNVYGPRMDIHGRYTEVLIRWMERLEAGQPPIIFGDGRQTMDFVHVRDVARANIFGAKANIDDEVFNVASGVETSLLELAQVARPGDGSRHGIDPEFAPERSVNPVPRRLATTAKAEAPTRLPDRQFRSKRACARSSIGGGPSSCVRPHRLSCRRRHRDPDRQAGPR